MTDVHTVAPYGAWKSPLTAERIAAGCLKLGQVIASGKEVFWLEGRAHEGGRVVIAARRENGLMEDIIHAPFSARTLVHEYGGAPVAVSGDSIFFTNYSDQRIYSVDRNGGEPQPLTAPGDWRYADMIVDAARSRIICVCEDHRKKDTEPENQIVAIKIEKDETGGFVPSAPEVLVAGDDFYAYPRLSPDGTMLTWISWNHPDMPWDGTTLYLAGIKDDGGLSNTVKVAGSRTESIFQPSWSPDGRLFFASDRSGWWNLYVLSTPQPAINAPGDSLPSCEAVLDMEAEFGMPLWIFGMSTYAFLSNDRILSAFNRQGSWSLGVIDISQDNSCLEEWIADYCELAFVTADGAHAAMLAGSPLSPLSVVALDADSRKIHTVRPSFSIVLDSEFVSTPEPIEFATDNGLTAHAFYYPPRNGNFRGPDGELPPLLVKSHGGPTGATSSALRLEVQYWTSRGIAVLDVNYGGSTGYGTAYRRRLDGNWGIVDVRDCENAARHLVEKKLVDGKRLAITGGSAGGYTTLCALTMGNVFRAGASHFGIGDLEAMTRDTHKFESRYLDRLIGVYPAEKEIYHQRSPINFTDKLDCPVIFLQGLEDKVVPPNQAEAMVGALRQKGLPVAYIAFEGEQHGFRKADNIRKALESEFYFYSRVFGFEPDDEVEPIAIENLSSLVT